MKFLGLIFPLGFTLFTCGCGHFHNDYYSYSRSVEIGNYTQAAERLRRCVKTHDSDQYKCQALYNELQKNNLPLDRAIYLKQRETEDAASAIAEQKRAEEASRRIAALRSSDNPWDTLRLVLEIQGGAIPELYTGEQVALLEKSFFGFGVCAKSNVPECMSQYAQMILAGTKVISEDKKKDAKKKALYWLNLAARYGNEQARRQLLELEEPIPTPDLAMELLQKNANHLAEQSISQRRDAQMAQEFYNTQMVSEIRQQNFMLAMNQFFPRTVNCTSNKFGSMTYTHCN